MMNGDLVNKAYKIGNKHNVILKGNKKTYTSKWI